MIAQALSPAGARPRPAPATLSRYRRRGGKRKGVATLPPRCLINRGDRLVTTAMERALGFSAAPSLIEGHRLNHDQFANCHWLAAFRADMSRLKIAAGLPAGEIRSHFASLSHVSIPPNLITRPLQ